MPQGNARDHGPFEEWAERPGDRDAPGERLNIGIIFPKVRGLATSAMEWQPREHLSNEDCTR
jgi:hypothetical protein